MGEPPTSLGPKSRRRSGDLPSNATLAGRRARGTPGTDAGQKPVFGEPATEQTSLSPRLNLGATARVAQDPLGERKFATRIDDHTTRRNKDSLKTKAQSQSQSSNPCRRRAILASISNHARPLGTPPDSPPVHCLVNTVGRRRQRRARRLFDNRILSGAPATIFMPVGGPQRHAEFDIALPPSVSSFLRPLRNPPPGPVATGSAPLPPAGFRCLLYVNSLI